MLTHCIFSFILMRPPASCETSASQEKLLLFFSVQKNKNEKKRRDRGFKNASRKAVAGSKIEKNDCESRRRVGTQREAAAIFYEGDQASFSSVNSSLSRPLFRHDTPRFLLRSLPHAIGSSRFGGHCTATGGCSGVVVGESIFHDNVVASSVGKLPPPSPTHCPLPCSSPRCAYPRGPHNTWLRLPLLRERRGHPLQDAGRSILRRRLYIRLPRIFPPFKSQAALCSPRA